MLLGQWFVSGWIGGKSNGSETQECVEIGTYRDPHYPAFELDELRWKDGVPRHDCLCAVVSPFPGGFCLALEWNEAWSLDLSAHAVPSVTFFRLLLLVLARTHRNQCRRTFPKSGVKG